MSERLFTTDVLVIGGGLAGERCAIEAAAAGHEVLVLSVVPPRRSHSCAAQGGMQASLGNCVKAEGDNPTIHFLDTVRGSDWGADQEVVRMFTHVAPKAIRELAAEVRDAPARAADEISEAKRRQAVAEYAARYGLEETQLERAIEETLRLIEADPPKRPTRAPYPVK